MGKHERKILITGASGLLGRELVKVFCQKNFHTLAHYHSNQPFEDPNCQWLKGDFKNLDSIRAFLKEHQQELWDVGYLINNYGPITYKKTRDLVGEDFIHDFEQNVIPAYEITKYLLDHSNLRMVINVLFKDAGLVKAYENILPYSMAKTSLSLLTESFLITYPETGFKNAYTPQLKGAAVKGKGKDPILPEVFAKRIYHMMDLD